MKKKNRSSIFKKLMVLLAAVTLSLGAGVMVQAAAVGTPSISVKTATADTQKVSWKRISNASGYQVAAKTGGGSYKTAATVTKGTTLSATIKNRLLNKRYTYRVRAYRVAGGKKTYGKWSAEKTAYLNKYQAVYGKTSIKCRPGEYYSYSAAKKNLKTITVKTWDFVNGKSGRKFTRSWTIQVHKNIASAVKKAFDEIYKGKEKFPIHELGGWRWGSGRSEHYDGTAIDINWTENAYFVNGKALVGSFYRPGKNPYSIPKNGEVAKIFKKYGFTQGIWRSSQDYMHFSYFGT